MFGISLRDIILYMVGFVIGYAAVDYMIDED